MTAIKRGKKWWVSFRFNRIRYRKTSPENSYAGAKAYESTLRQRLSRGEPINGPQIVKKDRPTLKNFAHDWFEGYVKTNNKLSEVRSKKSILKVYVVPYFGRFKLDEITSYDIEKYKAERQKQGLSNKYINNTLIVLSKCLRTAKDWEILEIMPKIKLLKVPPAKFDYLSPMESDQLLETTDGQLHDLILFALNTGLRFGELIAITWKEVSFKNEMLTVSRAISRGYLGSTKSNKTRYIPLNRQTMSMLEQRKSVSNKNNLVFYNTHGNFLIQEWCREKLHKACQKAGLRKIGWHTFRHTFASRLAENGVSMRTIQELLGHSDPNTTMRYAHLSPLISREAVKTLERPKNFNFGHNIATVTNLEEKNDIPKLNFAEKISLAIKQKQSLSSVDD